MYLYFLCLFLLSPCRGALLANSILNNIYNEQLENDLLNNIPKYNPNWFEERTSRDPEKGSNDLGNDYMSCKDEAGQPVDWWILYKLPVPQKSGKTYSDFVNNGTGYTYILSNNNNQPWTLSSKSMEDVTSLPGQTLAPVYKNLSNIMTFMYNDEKPDGPTSFNLGHTKGVLFGDEYSGVWMIHSVPHFPPYPNQSYGYPHTGHRYGQTFLCISVRSEAMNGIGRQFLYNEPFTYGVQMPDWTKDSKFSDLQLAAKNKHIKVAPFFHQEYLNTLGGVEMTSFAKHTLFNQDLYAALVAPGLKTSLLVETWPNGSGRMNSSCQTPYVVENVAEIDFVDIKNEDFTTHHDHAKWAISLDSKKPFVCIGDINRMLTQFKRGGGTTCFSNLSVWKTFKSSIKEIEACPTKRRFNKFSKKRWGKKTLYKYNL